MNYKEIYYLVVSTILRVQCLIIYDNTYRIMKHMSQNYLKDHLT